MECANTALKKIAAIFLIAILAFNWYGYRIVTSILALQADRQLEEIIDNGEYHESQLLEIKVALSLPYLPEDASFERCYGEIKLNGRYYTYVKRKVQRGYLILQCIQNSDKEKIKSAGDDFFKLTNGLDGSQPDQQQKQSASFAKNFWSEYDDRDINFFLNALLAAKAAVSETSVPPLHNTYTPSPAQPPEII